MLETLREYAIERLEARGEAPMLRDRHLAFFRDLAEHAEPHLMGADQGSWLDRLEAEHPNIQTALEWALEHDAPEDGLRLATAAVMFWHLRGHDREGYQWLERLLAGSGTSRSAVRARALPAAAMIAWLFGDHRQARAWCEEGVPLCQAVGDLPSLAGALLVRGLSEPEHSRRLAFLSEALTAARQAGDTLWVAQILWCIGGAWLGQDDEQAQMLLAESLTLFRQLGNAWGIGWVCMDIADLALRGGDYRAATALAEEGLAQTTAVGHSAGIARALLGLGQVALDRGDYVRSAKLLDEGLARFRVAGHRVNIAALLCMRGKVALAQDDLAHAATLIDEARRLYESLADRRGIAQALHLLGRIAQREGDLQRASALLNDSLVYREATARDDVPESLEALASLAGVVAHNKGSAQGQARRAARLWGAAEGAREVLGMPLRPIDREVYNSDIATMRAQIDDATFAAAWAEGRAMTLEQAIAYALEEVAEA
jgi:tetratricopeptide (TPR) repeat protein